jgi:hypothetical protein
MPSVQHEEQPRPREKRWKTGSARSKQVVEAESIKRQKLVKEPVFRSHILLFDMKRVGQPVRWRTLRKKSPEFAMTSNIQGAQYVHRVVSPNTEPAMSESGGKDRIAKLEQMVKQLNTEWSNKSTFLEERVARLEQVNHVRKAESRKRKKSFDPLLEIQGARFAWSTLLGGRGATSTQSEDIPLWSDDEEVNEEDVQVEHKQMKNGTQPLKTTQPTCSKLYCARKTIAFKNGKWKQQCEHCISLSKKKTPCASNSSLPITTKVGTDSFTYYRIEQQEAMYKHQIL